MAQPHIKLTSEQALPVCVVVGDPARTQKLGALCDGGAEQIAYNREYCTLKCTHQGVSFLVTSHGIGSAGALICFEELIKVGVKVLIRAGTAGSLQPNVVRQGDVVALTACVRAEGASRRMIAPEYPACASHDVVAAIEAAIDAVKQNKGAFEGSTHIGYGITSDLFYPGVDPSLGDDFKLWGGAGVKCVEMESATLMTCASLRGVKSGALVAIDGSPLQWDEGNYDPEGVKVAQGKTTMLRASILAAVSLTKAYEEGC